MNVKATQPLDIRVFKPGEQARGAFDGGRITEIKPIGFPGEGSAVKRVGPLFYWAWATSHSPALIGMHPHRGFEIMSYVVEGSLSHRDSLGTRSVVGPGGAQMMQTGSGVSHEEETLDKGTQFFQIWFEPELAKALRRPPTYREFQAESLPTTERDGVSVKYVLGDGAPFSFVADASMRDVTVASGSTYDLELKEGRLLAVVAVSGRGVWRTSKGREIEFGEKDFTVVEAEEGSTLTAIPRGSEGLRLAVVETAAHVDYPLYQA